MLSSENIRFDFAGALTAPRPQRDGTVIFAARAARTGAHQYPWGVERRDADELARIATQLPGLPVTAGHPSKLLSDGGVAEQVGKVVSARVDGDHVAVEIQLDANGAAYARAGMKELSLGYGVKPVAGWQTGTRSDHLALVFDSRCGPSCSIRTDCAGGCDHAPALEIQVANHLLGAF